VSKPRNDRTERYRVRLKGSLIKEGRFGRFQRDEHIAMFLDGSLSEISLTLVGIQESISCSFRKVADVLIAIRSGQHLELEVWTYTLMKNA
jgi:hypothetical protein